MMLSSVSSEEQMGLGKKENKKTKEEQGCCVVASYRPARSNEPTMSVNEGSTVMVRRC